MDSKRILVVLGTRPEAIKQAPVVWALRQRVDVDVRVLSTGQHREMLKPLLGLLNIVPDYDLDLMEPNQTLARLTARCLTVVDEILGEFQPETVLVQGDTTTAMAAGLAAFYRRIPVGHVEAGLRSGSLDEPFPEEANRLFVDAYARWLFAPTGGAAELLRQEGVSEERILVTGNTVVDALQLVQKQLANVSVSVEGLDESRLAGRKQVLVTCHRRESFGEPIEAIFRAIARLASEHPECEFLYPVHLNPRVQEPAKRLLGSLSNVQLLPPVPYDQFVTLMARAALILTDSGGVQEEGPSFGVPVLVMRNRTERPEGVEAGCARLIGNTENGVYEQTKRLLTEDGEYARMAQSENPYGDGTAGERIAKAVLGEQLDPWKT